MILLNFLLIALLIGLNGFFVMIEFAAVASRKSRLEVMLGGRKTRAGEIVKTWLENPASRDRLIAAAQFGVTIVSLALGAVGENTFAALLEPLFHDQSLPPVLESLGGVVAALPLVLSLTIVTSLHVVLGEQVPKVASLHAPERFALTLAVPMHWFITIFKWFVDMLDWATRHILKLFGLSSGSGHSVIYTVEEIRQIVAESEEVGVLEQPDREMLDAIFDISDLLVRQVMIPRTEIQALEADQTIVQGLHFAAETNYTKFPVYDDDLDDILGVVYLKDMLRSYVDPAKKEMPVRSLVREALFVPETISVKALLQQFRARKQHIAIVLDEYGGTSGLVTLEDLMEEIVGEVSDYFDVDAQEIEYNADGTISVNGVALLDEVNEALGLNLQEPHYDTIAGYVLGKLGRIPEVGEIVESDGVRIRVEEMAGRRIARLSLEVLESPAKTGGADDGTGETD